MAANLFTVYATLGLDSKGLNNGLKDATKHGETFSQKLTSGMGKVTKAVGQVALAATAAAGAFAFRYIKDAMAASNEFAQAQTKLATVMRNTMDASDQEIASIVKLAATYEMAGVVSQTAQVAALAEMSSYLKRSESLEGMLPILNDYIAFQYGANATSEQAVNVATALGKALDGNTDGIAKQGFAFDESQKEIFKYGSEQERVAALADIISESMGGVNSALAKTDAGKMFQLNAAMNKTKIQIGDMANAFRTRVVEEMLPSVSGLLDAFKNLISGEGSTEELSAAFGAFFGDITSLIADALPTLLSAGANIFLSVVKGITDALPGLTAEAIPIVTNFITMLAGQAGDILSAGMSFVTELITGIGNALPTLIPAAVEMVTTLVSNLIEKAPQLIAAAAEFLVQLAKGLVGAVTTLTKEAPEIIKKLLAAIIEGVPVLLDAGASIISAIAEGLGEISPIFQPIADALSWLSENFDAVNVVIGAVALSILAYNAVSALATTATGGFSLSQTLLAAKTKIVTAAQWLWNAAMAANPIGLIVAGIVLLTGLVIGLSAVFNKETEEQRELRLQTEALIESTDKLTKSVEDNAKAYEDKAKGIIDNATMTSRLTDQVYELAAAENKSAADKAKLAAMVDQLNKYMPELNMSYDAESDALNRTASETYALIEAKKEEAKTNAARERANQLIDEQAQAELKLKEVQAQRAAIQAKLDAEGTNIFGWSQYDKTLKQLTETEEQLTVQIEITSLALDNATNVMVESSDAQVVAMGRVATAQEEAAEAALLAAENQVSAMNDATDAASEQASAIEATTDIMQAAYERQAEIEEQRRQEAQATADAMVASANEMGVTLEEYKAELQRIADEEAAIQKEREKAIEGYTKVALDMFNQIQTASELTASNMADNLEHNQQAMLDWSSNIAMMAERFDADFVQEMKEKGPQAAGEIANLANATAEEVERINAAWLNGKEVVSQVMDEVYGDAGATAAERLGSGFDNEMNSQEDIMTGAVETAGDLAGEVAVTAVNQGMISNIDKMDDGISQIVGAVESGLTEKIPEFASHGESIVQKIADGILAKLDYWKTVIADFIGTGRTETDSTVDASGFNEPGTSIVEKISEGIANAIEKVKAAISGIITGIKAAADEQVIESNFLSVGKAIADGIADGISNGATAITNAAKQAAKSAYDAAMSSLQAASPSKLMMKVGGYFSEGFAEGISGSISDVITATNRMTDAAVSSVNPFSHNIATPALATAGPGQSIVYNQYVTTPKPLSESELTREAQDMIKRQSWQLP